MDLHYLKGVDRVRFTAAELESLLSVPSLKTFEDKQAYRAFENLLADMLSVIDKVEFLIRPVIEGRLQENDNSKFELVLLDGKSTKALYCGSLLEVYSPDEGEWFSGTVEHKNGKYYFDCAELKFPALFTGMSARVR